MRNVFRVVFWFLGPITSKNVHRIPKQGGVIILANHLSDVDPFALQISCPRGLRSMGKSELFSMKLVGWFLRWWGAFPVERGKPDREAIRRATELAQDGSPVLIFPEGQLSEDGKLQEIKPGAALIIRMAKVPVMCCGLKNTQRVLPYGKLMPRPAFARVHVNWGEPKQFGEYATGDEIIAWIESELHNLTR